MSLCHTYIICMYIYKQKYIHICIYMCTQEVTCFTCVYICKHTFIRKSLFFFFYNCISSYILCTYTWRFEFLCLSYQCKKQYSWKIMLSFVESSGDYVAVISAVIFLQQIYVSLILYFPFLSAFFFFALLYEILMNHSLHC